MQGSKPCALPLGDGPGQTAYGGFRSTPRVPRIKRKACRSPDRLPQGGYWDSNPRPPEPQSGALTSCAIPTISNFLFLTGNVPEGIRTPDTRLRRPLLYPTELLAHIPSLFVKRKAGDGNRTHVSSLEGWRTSHCTTPAKNILNSAVCSQRKLLYNRDFRLSTFF